LYPFDYDDNYDYLVQYDNDNRGRGNSPSFPGGMPGGFPGGMPGGFPGGMPGGAPGGFPGGMPGGTPGGFPGGGNQLSAPTAPPPSFTPQTFTTTQQQEFHRHGGVGGIRRCMFRNTFVWMKNGNSFWFFPMLIMGNSIVGFRWRGNRGWVYDSINRNNILFFQCY
jgi:hypothetical protein